MKQFACMILLLLTPGLISAAPASDTTSLTGLWKTDGSIAGQQVRMMCALTETKHNLSGVCSGAQDGYIAHKIAGTIKAQKVQFYFQAAFGGNSLTLIVNGTLNEDGTQMDGDMEVAPMGDGMNAEQMNLGGTLTAVKELEHAASAVQADAAASQTDATAAQIWADDVRAGLSTGNNVATNYQAATTAAEAAPAGTVVAETAGAAAASIVATGTWKIDGTVMGTPVTMTCVLTETDHKLAGICSGAGEGRTQRALTGTATPKGLGWSFDDQYGGQPITFSMNATLVAKGTKMNGTMTVAPMGVNGTFAAVKQ